MRFETQDCKNYMDEWRVEEMNKDMDKKFFVKEDIKRPEFQRAFKPPSFTYLPAFG